MKARTFPRMALSTAASLALTFGAFGAPGAYAAALANHANATTAAETSPLAALPPTQHAGDIAYRSGGIGSDQSAAFKAAMARYPLSLEFARQSADGNEYLANVPVQIADAHGQTLLATRANGPFMLVTLPDGHYIVTASHDGKTVHRAVDIGKTAHAHEAFVWPM
ncbi:carboxypeptidase regulatory-like domain-containing protein [Paraburkholderia sp. J94]|uniref:carboxypeptidase regulatory-like domain-containing protein n=1 Tax=Paraburkholderia sp. J94 TaxID=2805441 RepID=UPI002AB13CA7|nr:carboxypeptidase regulatory-like domain-containing protein [Paraburkholderia sp. J94]